jgi:hypothetical protein
VPTGLYFVTSHFEPRTGPASCMGVSAVIRRLMGLGTTCHSPVKHRFV